MDRVSFIVSGVQILLVAISLYDLLLGELSLSLMSMFMAFIIGAFNSLIRA